VDEAAWLQSISLELIFYGQRRRQAFFPVFLYGFITENVIEAEVIG
jgi:hypothetical protein